MAKDKTRIDLSGEDTPLAHNPFAALQPLKAAALPEHVSAPTVQAAKTPTPEAFRVERTRKGGLHIRLEHRARGKMVTVIGNVAGDAEELLRQLKRHCGAGGVVREDSVEIQGDHRERIEKFLEK